MLLKLTCVYWNEYELGVIYMDKKLKILGIN